jgi:hypothetical protein
LVRNREKRSGIAIYATAIAFINIGIDESFGFGAPLDWAKLDEFGPLGIVYLRSWKKKECACDTDSWSNGGAKRNPTNLSGLVVDGWMFLPPPEDRIEGMFCRQVGRHSRKPPACGIYMLADSIVKISDRLEP